MKHLLPTLVASAVMFSTGAATAAPFTINAGTVLDASTGLTWQQGSGANTLTGSEAKAYCAGLALAGRTWRLPSIAELQTIVDYTISPLGPLIDKTAFPNTPAELFWSSTDYPSRPIFAWYLDFAKGLADIHYVSHMDNKYRARCVSGTATASLIAFKDNADGTITDTGKGLVWEKAVAAPCNGTCTQAQAAAYCTAKGQGWRLPLVAELQRLVDFTISVPGPTISATFFPSTPIAPFWTSSPYLSADGTVRYVNFYNGASSARNATDKNWTRCVR